MLSFAKSPSALVGNDIYHRTVLQKLLYDADPCDFHIDPEVQPKEFIWTVSGQLCFSPGLSALRNKAMFNKMKKSCSGFEPFEQLCLLTE